MVNFAFNSGPFGVGIGDGLDTRFTLQAGLVASFLGFFLKKNYETEPVRKLADMQAGRVVLDGRSGSGCLPRVNFSRRGLADTSPVVLWLFGV